MNPQFESSCRLKMLCIQSQVKPAATRNTPGIRNTIPWKPVPQNITNAMRPSRTATIAKKVSSQFMPPTLIPRKIACQAPQSHNKQIIRKIDMA